MYGELVKHNKKYISKVYHTPKILEEKIQCDVKFLPHESYKKTGSMSNMCQYTFIDEATRLRFLYPTKESNTFESIEAFRKKNETLTMFESRLDELWIILYL